ncbi:MAG: response regulator [Deltaproteobacteria bacterium]|nr:response regulator [Deltaproteobacteria bacterium]
MKKPAIVDKTLAVLAPARVFGTTPERFRRARLVAAFTFLVSVVGAILGSLEFYRNGGSAVAWIPLAATLAGLGSFVAFRVSRSVKVGGHLLTVSLAVGMTSLSAMTGGLSGPVSLRLAAVPIVALALLGPRVGAYWLVIIWLDLGALALAQETLSVIAAPMNGSQIAAGFFGHLFFVGVIYLLMAIYVIQREQAAEERRLSEAALHASEMARKESEIEAQLMRSHRMAELGTLAAGVAHEINNPLSYIQGNISYLQQVGLSMPEAELEILLDDVQHGAERIARIVQDIGTFSRVEPEAGEVSADVIEALEASVRLVENRLSHSAEVARDFDPDLPQVRADASRLQQVFVNVLTNAIQALEGAQGEGTHVGVEGDASVSRRGMIELRAQRVGADRVRVTIRDDGPGIPKAIQGRVLEPFFTTKAVGEGTGLGLSICFGIVTKFGGTLTIDSDEGAGTGVAIDLPAASGGDESTSEAAQAREVSAQGTGVAADTEETTLRAIGRTTRGIEGASRSASGEVRQGGDPSALRRLRILVVDDEPAEGAVLTRLLHQHEVTAVQGGQEALTLLAGGLSVDVLLCDLMMPDMSGMALHERLAVSHPSLADRMVFITGGAFSEEAQAFVDAVENPCLEKPLEMAALEAALAERGYARSKEVRP